MKLLKTLNETLKLPLKNKLKRTYLVQFLYILFGGLLSFFQVFLTILIISLVEISGETAEFIAYILIVVGVALISSVLSIMLKRVLYNLELRIRETEYIRCARFYNKVSYKYVESSKFNDDFQTAFRALENDGDGLQEIFSNTEEIFRNLLSIILFLIILGRYNFLIVLFCVLNTAVVTLINSKIAKYIDKRIGEENHASRQAYYFNKTTYDFEYGKDIRIFNLKNFLLGYYKEKINKYLGIRKNVENRKFLYKSLQVFTLILQNLFAFYVMIKGYREGSIEGLWEVVLIATSYLSLSLLLNAFIAEFSPLVTNLKYTEVYFKFLNNNSYFETNEGKVLLSDPSEGVEIEFKNVSFKYPETENYILSNLSFKIKKNEKLAIVGINGAGKSTIVKLLSRMYEVNDGEILINGINILEYDKKSYNLLLSTVFQNFNIYAATVLENVTGIESDKAKIERAKECIDMVGLKDKINSLDLKYDTPLLKVIDENGVDLSGGEKQKLAIARALYKDGGLVILDEPTAALDALAEGEIYNSFNDLVKNKTAIYVSHRLSSTKFCDNIALFSKEGLIEYGNHETLMKKKGEYYNMFISQAKYYEEGTKNDI